MNRFRTQTGGLIDRTQSVRFRFDGQPLKGYAGDTLASALLANGIHLTGRSFKYHRPRGILSAGADEPNALVTVSRDAARTTPNLRATQVELYRNLTAFSQNHWPSLEFDFGRINDKLSRFFPAGFYYKTFMWPKKAWKSLYEPIIRRAAGLGVAPAEPDPDRYAQRYAHCDVLVVGGGHEHRPRTDLDPIAIEIALRGSGQQDTGPIVARKYQRPFDGAGRQHHPAGPHLPQPFARRMPGRRGEMIGDAFVQPEEVVRKIAESGGAGEQRHPRVLAQFGRRSMHPVKPGLAVDPSRDVAQKAAAELR